MTNSVTFPTYIKGVKFDDNTSPVKQLDPREINVASNASNNTMNNYEYI